MTDCQKIPRKVVFHSYWTGVFLACVLLCGVSFFSAVNSQTDLRQDAIKSQDANKSAVESRYDLRFFQFLREAVEIPIRPKTTVIRQRSFQPDGSVIYSASSQDKDGNSVDFSVRLSKKVDGTLFVTAFNVLNPPGDYVEPRLGEIKEWQRKGETVVLPFLQHCGVSEIEKFSRFDPSGFNELNGPSLIFPWGRHKTNDIHEATQVFVAFGGHWNSVVTAYEYTYTIASLPRQTNISRQQAETATCPKSGCCS